MNDVPRETPPPPSAAGAFLDRLELAERYWHLLATGAVQRGLIGPREVPRLWDRHIMNSVVVVPRVPMGSSVADVGSGAGLPGLVWAIARPDLCVTLIEPLLRRTTYLSEVISDLGLESSVRVIRGRADEVDETFDVVTARAVAPLDKLVRWCMPLVGPRGAFLALKGASVDAEVESAASTIEQLGGQDTSVARYGDLDVPTTVVEISRQAAR